ncbi:MAG: diaminopimelate epimerase [Pseudomonadota bacterium]
MTSQKKKTTFEKMVSIGNDSIIIDARKHLPANPSHVAKKLCNRKNGIGADQLIFLTNSKKADFGMKVYNADGSEATMCGNGIRGLARYINDHKLSTKKLLNIETASGIKPLKIKGKNIEVDLGEPLMRGEDVPVNFSGRVVNRPLKIENKDFRITCLSVGNPHCIIFQDDLKSFDVCKFGPMIEASSIFPKKANISFVNVFGKNEIQIRVWERGVGESLGCGTAASAATIAGVLNGFTDRKVTVHFPGGKLEVTWDQKTNHVHLKGPAETVFSGEITL